MLHASEAPAMRYVLGRRQVVVFDGLLNNVDEYVSALDGAAFKRTEIARPDTAEHRHWAVEIPLDVLVRQAIYAPTLTGLGPWLGANGDYRPYRAYTNVALYGDMLFSHVDCLPGAGDVTALWYLCREWDLEWGGETVFFDDREEILCAVRPRPGRLVVFDGDIAHAGRPPHRTCYKSRYTLAIKFERASV